MNNYRLEIESLILSTILNQDKTHDLDKMELEDYKLDYKLFKANKSTKLVSKAIYNLRELNKPISIITIEEYLRKHNAFIESEMIGLYSALWTTYDTMKKYVEVLKEIELEEQQLDNLRAI